MKRPETLTPECRDRLVVILRPDSWLDVLPADAPRPISFPVASGMSAYLQMDWLEEFTSVSEQTLVDLGVDEHDAFSLALTNLKNRMGPVIREEEQGLQVVMAESGLATGLPLLANSLEFETSRTIAILLTGPDRYISADTSDSMAFELLMNICYGMLADGEAFTDTILFRENGNWSSARAKIE